MPDHRPTAVFGAGGAQGGAAAQALLDAGRPVRALSRDPEAVAARIARGAEHAVADLSAPDTLTRALDGVGSAFVMIPFDAPPPVHAAYVDAVLDALRAAGAPRAVFTLSGPVPTADTGGASLDARRSAANQIADSGLPITTFVPGGYLGNLLGPWVAPAIVHQGRVPYPLPAGLRRPWVSVEDQARLAVAALDRPDLAQRSFTIGHLASGVDLAAALAQALDRDVTWVALDLEEFAASLVTVVGAAAASELAREYRLTAEHPAVRDSALDADLTARELGVELTSLTQWAREQDWTTAATVPPGG